MKKALFLALALSLFVSFIPAASRAAVPATLSYQGTLTDKAGNPVTASRTVVFTLYDAATGGTNLWTEAQTLTVTNGRFGAVLGVVNALDVSMLYGNTWLGIAVQGEPEMTPRQKLTSVAYAMRAQVAENVASTDSLQPAGGVIAFAGTVAPPGWLICDGTEYDAQTNPQYLRLFNAIGVAHGGDAATKKFRVPDYRGRFLRGVDRDAGNDPDKADRRAMWDNSVVVGNVVGSVQGDEFKQHTHNINLNHDPGLNHAPPKGTNMPYGTGVTEPAGGSETRPINAYVNWIIKY